ncbi:MULTISPECIES: prephenate dehydrogenase [Clostridium]|uniref:Prephenate dehydrogenase n=1 Tax=Clostridium ragsdalei P11 TaxID=1353534 RepID=A0A1A6AJW7_9CLOT|nr:MULTISPECIES: prephenate dehydrogenase [Clostridium]OBR90339.1 prephenate dehydrogenase [Clostridium ragsdalei P11]QXE18142.1 prephenate dehydrogenase [Clostridium sp. 001]
MDDSDFKLKVAIVGMGLIGGSYAMALRPLNTEQVIGIDNDKNTLESALNMGIIDRGYERGGSFLKEIDLIIIALYPKDTVKFVEDNFKYLKSGAIITDTSGIKKCVVSEINSFLPECLEFVPGHPMAGNEFKGIAGASKDIFKGANYIITPTSRNTSRGIDLIHELARKIGCSNVTCISPEKHDRIITFTSQLPHVIAVSLMNSQDQNEENIKSFTGGSFRDATRVAQINTSLWTELFTMNSDILVEEIEKFEESINLLKKAIISKDVDSIKNIFEKASSSRRELVKR